MTNQPTVCPACQTGYLNRRAGKKLQCSYCGKEFPLPVRPPLDEREMIRREAQRVKDELWSSNLLMRRKFVIPKGE